MHWLIPVDFVQREHSSKVACLKRVHIDPDNGVDLIFWSTFLVIKRHVDRHADDNKQNRNAVTFTHMCCKRCTRPGQGSFLLLKISIENSITNTQYAMILSCLFYT